MFLNVALKVLNIDLTLHRYSGAAWRTCHCPVCGQALGWQWTRDPPGTRATLGTFGNPGTRGIPETQDTRDTRAEYSWVGLRLGRVVDWSDSLLGPLADLPQLVNSLG